MSDPKEEENPEEEANEYLWYLSHYGLIDEKNPPDEIYVEEKAQYYSVEEPVEGQAGQEPSREECGGYTIVKEVPNYTQDSDGVYHLTDKGVVESSGSDEGPEGDEGPEDGEFSRRVP